MFWHRKSEIEKVLDRFGQTKGTQFLTYFCTYITKSYKLIKNNDKESMDFTSDIINYIRENHGQEYLMEYSKFFSENIRNRKLLGELSKTGIKYIDNSIGSPSTKLTEKKLKMDKPANPSAELVPNTEQASANAPQQPNVVKNPLGKDESKHIFCKFKGQEERCPYDCTKCAISIKIDGDTALSQNKLENAIRLYKKAVFAEPKFAEAWVNLGNAYEMKSEHSNALAAFDKALSIDPVYGKAMYGKAVSLRNMGKFEEAVTMANTILEIYDSEEVENFKKEILESGIEDTQYIIENKKAVIKLNNYGFKLMQDNNLLNEEGKITIIDGLYQPEDFTKQVFDYCKRKYASLGENKVHGECIITSFYGSICAAVLHSKDENVFTDTSAFAYLKDHIDMEFIDTNAERLLATKAGEEKAENIWGIISPYVKLAQEIFDNASVLTDKVILEAMKNAYVIGMLTAFYYISGKNKRHILATRLEIDKALLKLAQSSNESENPPPKSAMCYSIIPPKEVPIQYRCSKCGKIATMQVYEGEEDIINKYRQLATEFVKLGHNADILSLCNNCAEQYFPSNSSWIKHNIVFTFVAKGSDTPVHSFPTKVTYSDFEYKVALSFLNGSDTIEKLAEDTKSTWNANVYLKSIKNIIGSAESKEER